MLNYDDDCTRCPKTACRGVIREVQRASGSDDNLAQSDLEARINVMKIKPLQVDPLGQKVPKSIWAAKRNENM